MHALELDPVRVVQLQFCGVLDGDDALLIRKGADNGAQQRTFPRTGRDGHCLQKAAHRDRHAASAHPICYGGIPLVGQEVQTDAVELSNAEGGSTNRGVDRVGSATVDHAGVNQRFVEVDFPPDERDNFLDHLLQLCLIAESVRHELESATTFHIDLVKAIHKDVTDFRVGHQRLERTEPDDLVKEALDQFSTGSQPAPQDCFANPIPENLIAVRVRRNARCRAGTRPPRRPAVRGRERHGPVGRRRPGSRPAGRVSGSRVA